MSGEVQILQDAPTEPSPHTYLLYIPPFWRASHKASELQKKILVEKTFYRNFYAQGFAPDQYGPSVLHKRPFCNAFSGCGSGKRFFHSESTGCRKKAPKRVAGAPSNLSNNFKSERQWGGRGGFLLHSSYLNFFKASIAHFDFYGSFLGHPVQHLFTIIIISST